MGLYFFLGVVIYLLILVTLMVWFLKYHSDKDQGSSGPLENTPDSYGRKEAIETKTKPNHISKELFHSGVESVSQRSEVLPGYSSSPRS